MRMTLRTPADGPHAATKPGDVFPHTIRGRQFLLAAEQVTREGDLLVLDIPLPDDAAELLSQPIDAPLVPVVSGRVVKSL